MLQTNDEYKREVQRQWDRDACGSHYVKDAKPGTLEWYLEAEAYRYGTYAPWMPEHMEFYRHEGHKVLEIGAGMGTDLAQFAKGGAIVTDLDLSLGHLEHARTNFKLRGLDGEFKQGDGETLPFPDNSFDVVYSNGVIHHTPNTTGVIREIHRVLKPGGKAIVMVYAENSLHYWRQLFLKLGIEKRMLDSVSIGEIMSQHVEISEHDSRPLVKVYTAARLRRMFGAFERTSISKRQMLAVELPRGLQWMPIGMAGRLMGWNLIVKATKPGPRRLLRRARDIKATATVAANLAARKWRQSRFVPRSSFEEELAARDRDFTAWLAERRKRPRTYAEIPDAAVAQLKVLLPNHASRTLASAEQALEHRFDLLGSGPYQPIDPDRAVSKDGYRPIDWYLDPVRGVRFPTGIPIKQWKLFEMRPKDGDIKYPWELGRCQHFAALGQAWRMTGDVRFAREIVDEIDDFMAANPVGIGVNWTCTMDVGIRAANWALGLGLIKDCTAIETERFRIAWAALFEHGRFVFENLENIYEVTSNHFLSNVIGLHFVSAEFIETASGAKWDAFCRKSLEAEIDVQILPDGADFESSVPYHRLVAELFLGSWRLAELQGRPLSPHYRDRLGDMVDYLVGVLRPDGLMPQLGDADDGRLHIFTDYATWTRQDGRHLIGAAGAVFKRKDWSAVAGADGAWEAAWWGLPPATLPVQQPPADQVKLYADAGAFIARQGGTYLLVTNAKVGTKGFGNHKHNDQLSFELHVGGEPVIVDPGSYVYTSDFAARNHFRSTAAHSTLAIDNVEQNEVNPEWLFRMFEKAEAEHLTYGERQGQAIYSGRHVGYKRLASPVVHTRSFEIELASGRLDIKDRLDGEGQHDVVWRFQLAPGVSAQASGAGRLSLMLASGRGVELKHPDGLEVTVIDGWYSPSYGVRTASRTIELRCRQMLRGSAEWAFVFAPAYAVGRA
ncbi:MAG: heparinase II/III family protein [Hyphomicrobiaceae bacterium]